MRKNTLTFLSLFAFIFLWASLPPRYFGGGRNLDERNSTTLLLDSVPEDSAAGKATQHKDTTALTAGPDTTKMDSLQLAIYHHNKAIDDSLAFDSINRRRKNGIDSPVKYTAEDSLTYEAASGLAFLYGNSNVKYQDMDLQSDKIYMNLDSSLVHATGSADSTGALTGTPVFQMGSA